MGGLLPSPIVLLAAIAERTSIIRLGTAVVTAGLEDPVRMAEDAAVLDALSGECGLDAHLASLRALASLLHPGGPGHRREPAGSRRRLLQDA